VADSCRCRCVVGGDWSAPGRDSALAGNEKTAPAGGEERFVHGCRFVIVVLSTLIFFILVCTPYSVVYTGCCTALSEI